MSDIAINPVDRRVQFVGNTGTGPYAFTFNILQSSDIIVYKNNVLLTETTDYTMTIDANGTGNVTLVVALVSTDILTMIGGRELSRTTDFVTAGDLLASSLNEQLDSNVIMSQQLDERFGRTIKAQPGDEDATLDLPLVADRANRLMMFDTEGNASVASEDALGNIIIGANFITDAFTGDGSTVAFTLSVDANSKNNTQVHVDGVYQNKAGYSLNGAVLTFSEAPPLNAAVEVVSGDSIAEGNTANSSAVEYNQGGTGAVDRTVKAKLQETVSVKDFGAVGDGVTDDTAAIQAAIDYSVSNGKSLYVPHGTYIISSRVFEQTNGARLNIFGAGRTASVFKGSAALTNTAMFWFGNNNGHGVYGLFMRDIGLDGSLTTNCTGIVTAENGLSHFQNMRIRNWEEGANCDGSIHMIWDGHNEVSACNFGIRFRRIPVGTPSGPFDKSVTQHPIALSTNISKIENTWFAGVRTNTIVMEGGLVSVENCVFQSCGNNANQSIVIFEDCNESYDYGGGPRFINNWVESGVYKYWVEVTNSRNAILRDNFYSGPSAGTAEGAFLLQSKAENCIISGNSFRGSATATATEGRQRSSAAVYLNAQNAVNFAFTIKDNYVTKNSLNYVIDGVNITGNSSWRYSVFSDMNGKPPVVYDAGGSLAYMPDKTVHAAGSVTYTAGVPSLDFASNVSSIVDTGVGYLSVVYSRGKAITNQPLVTTVNSSAGTPLIHNSIRVSATVDRIIVYNTSGTQTDPAGISFTCLGGTN